VVLLYLLILTILQDLEHIVLGHFLLREKWDHKAHKAHKAHKVHADHKVHKAHKAHKDHRDHRVLALKDHKAQVVTHMLLPAVQLYLYLLDLRR
jgi:hypothetical protein